MTTSTVSAPPPAAAGTPGGPPGPAPAVPSVLPAVPAGRGVPAPAGDGPVGPVELGVPVRGSLSPSRAGDFMACPLRYRFRVVDRLPEPPSPAATRGTLVHGVLERLFDLPAPERTPQTAAAMVEPAWETAVGDDPGLLGLFDGPAPLAAWLTSARDLLDGYFTLEDPTRLQPAARELYVEHVLPTGLRLRGYLDRLDEAADGALRVVDYKTGRAPGPLFEASAMFQMRFYALLLWRTRGLVPRELRLYYLGDRAWLRYVPDESDLLATERKLEALWAAIERAHETGDWRPRPSRLCDWCDHKALCPAFGGEPPPLPAQRTAEAVATPSRSTPPP